MPLCISARREATHLTCALSPATLNKHHKHFTNHSNLIKYASQSVWSRKVSRLDTHADALRCWRAKMLKTTTSTALRRKSFVYRVYVVFAFLCVIETVESRVQSSSRKCTDQYKYINKSTNFHGVACCHEWLGKPNDVVLCVCLSGFCVCWTLL